MTNTLSTPCLDPHCPGAREISADCLEVCDHSPRPPKPCAHCDGEHAPGSPCICATCGLPSHDLAVVNVCNDGGLWLECRACRYSERTIAKKSPVETSITQGMRLGPVSELAHFRMEFDGGECARIAASDVYYRYIAARSRAMANAILSSASGAGKVAA